jgi:hypothetical protein
LPCDIISLTVEDVLNNKIDDYEKELVKTRITNTGEAISTVSYTESRLKKGAKLKIQIDKARKEN